jgi:hypothetical protein
LFINYLILGFFCLRTSQSCSCLPNTTDLTVTLTFESIASGLILVIAWVLEFHFKLQTKKFSIEPILMVWKLYCMDLFIGEVIVDCVEISFESKQRYLVTAKTSGDIPFWGLCDFIDCCDFVRMLFNFDFLKTTR